MPSPIVIRRSRVKLSCVLVFAFVFLAMGIWMWNLTDQEIRSARSLRSPAIIHSLGFLLIAMGSLGATLVLKSLLNASPGLIISDEGLTDKSNPLSLGFIPWSAVRALETRQIHKDSNQKILYLILLTPEKYILRCPFWKRLLLRLAVKVGPSPVGITSTGLDIDFEQLAVLADHRFRLCVQRVSTKTRPVGPTPE